MLRKLSDVVYAKNATHINLL